MNLEIQQEKNREMYTKEDVNRISDYIKENSLEKIYVVGGSGSGKSSFSEEISTKLDYKNIDLDDYSQLFSREFGRSPETQKEILDFALEKNTPPFVINHADLLRQGLIGNADLVVLLNPSKECLLKTRQKRLEAGITGDWKNIGEDRYDEIIEENKEKFDSLEGEVVYVNSISGTVVKKL